MNKTKHLLLNLLLFYVFFASSSLAAIDPKIKSQVNQEIQNLEKKKADMKTILSALSGHSSSQEQIKEDKETDKIIGCQYDKECKEWLITEFSEWRDELFASRKDNFSTFSSTRYQNCRSYLLKVARKISVDVERLILLLQQNGCTANQLLELQNNTLLLKNHISQLDELFFDMESTIKQINEFEVERRKLESRYAFDKNQKAFIKIETVYKCLVVFLKKWDMQSSSFFFDMQSIKEDRTGAVLENLKKLVD